MYRSFDVRVDTLERLSPHFVRVAFTGDELPDLGRPGPDQRIKLLFPPDNTMRTYTIRDADRDHGRLVVDFVLHGDAGPASRWVSRARTGDPLVVLAPDRASEVDGTAGYEWHPGSARTLLLAGDETAVPAIAAILESLPAGAQGQAFLEVPSPEDALPLKVPDGVAVTWLPRSGADHGCGLDAAVRTWASARASGTVPDRESLDEDGDILWDVPGAPTDAGFYAWLAGEAGAITRLRRHLVKELGIDRSRVAFMGYWRLGRAEN